MHIPDGYLGPSTCGFFYLAMVPIWAGASRIVKKTLNAKQVPLLAIGAAFSFVIMMFNVPIPGGSTGHAVGGVLTAILLGPWAACISLTVVLVTQALLFGDGGITAIGANCFNIAFIIPFSGYYIYKILSYKTERISRRRVIAAGVAGYIALNLGALATAIEFGVQPLLYHTADGQALYCPYGLKVAITAMCGGHLLIFGWVEAIVTALVIQYLQKQSPEFLGEGKCVMKLTRKLWIGIGVLILLTPLGLFLPEHFKAGSAWGEWGIEEVQKMVGYVPQGMSKSTTYWNAPLPDYAFKGWENKGFSHLSMAYIVSAVTGIVLVAMAMMVLGKYLSRKSK